MGDSIDYGSLMAQLDTRDKHIAALQSQVEALRADAARLDWLEAHHNHELSTDPYSGDWTVHHVNGPINDREWTPVCTAPNLRAAIDAARCTHCHGTGQTTISNYDGNGSDADGQPCPHCAEE